MKKVFFLLTIIVSILSAREKPDSTILKNHQIQLMKTDSIYTITRFYLFKNRDLVKEQESQCYRLLESKEQLKALIEEDKEKLKSKPKNP
jgi:hypothetical protein